MLTAATLLNFSPGQRPGAMLDFRDPVWSTAAHELGEVGLLLVRAEAAAREGQWVVMALSYEAAPAFDAAMSVHAANGRQDACPTSTGRAFPLAVAAAFEGQAEAAMGESGAGGFELGEWQPEISEAEWHEKLAAIHEYILAGDVYQVNYTFRQTAVFRGSGREWFRALSTGPRGGYHAWLDVGDWEIVSASPELFWEREGWRIATRPMKGTMPRGRWREEDAAQAERLRASAKNCAENIMIVDLLRNDLGRIARTGSVAVRDLFRVERYPGALQMTSTVEARLGEGAGLPEIMGALFPCGSITGAPKIRAMEIIRELERGPRGIYTGAIGLLQPGGRACFNVAIRTATIDKAAGRAVCGVGGGITHDSESEDEWRESALKTQFLIPRPEFQIRETMLYDEGKWFLLEGHLRRMGDSADYFGFDWDEGKVRNELESSRPPEAKAGRWRVRMLLGRTGCKLSFEWTRLVGAKDDGRVWRVALAAAPVDSRDVFLFHKTSRRGVYDGAKAERPDCDDVILWNERGEATETSIANLFIERDGRRVTPARGCGLLAGVMREAMIAAGEIEEGVIMKSELAPGREVTIINSVRKRIRAVMVE